MLVSGGHCQQTVWSTRVCLRILSLSRWQDVTCKVRKTDTVLLSCCWRGVLGRLYPWVCLCVGSGMKGYGWACTDKHMGHPVASSDQKPWLTTKRWSETHSSVWEQDRHFRRRMHMRAQTHPHTQTQAERLWCSLLRLFLAFQSWRGAKKGKGIHRGKSHL